MNQTASSSSDQQMSSAILQRFLSEHPIFSRLDEAEMLGLAQTMDVLALETGEILFRMGDPGDSVYLVLAGSLEARIAYPGAEGIRVGLLSAGDIVGEIAIMTHQVRTATIIAREGTRLVRLPNEAFTRLAERYPQMIEELNQKILPILRHNQLVSILVGLFGEINLPVFQEIQDQLVWRRLDAGEILFRQGDPADALYIVISGRLRIMVKDGEGERLIGEVSRGDFTGEFGLITNEPRSATLIAVRDTEVVQLSRVLFEQLWARHAPAMLQFTRLIVRRVERFNQPRVNRRAFTTIALVPVHPSVQIETFSSRLFEALSPHGSALLLSSRSFDDLYRRPGAAQTRDDQPGAVFIQDWLAEKESQHQTVLYQADAAFTPWTRRCLLQADRILLVGETTLSPAPGEIERMAAGMNLMARQDLVLIHPQGQNCASGTQQWLAPRQVSSHYHIRPDIPRDFQRMVRRLTGKAVGLVLSGGSARGWAHLGVIQALEEAGVEIDLIGGSSIGALLSGGYAYGYSFAEMIRIGDDFSKPGRLMDYTLPFVSLTASKNVTAMMRQVFGDVQIEDLCLPYFCVSTNLTRAEPMVHRAGPLWESVRASLAIPGVFTPILHGSDVLVDGGAIDNFPIEVMREQCEGGYVIGVNVGQKHEPSMNLSFRSSISGWQVLREKIFPFWKRQNVPSIMAILLRTNEVKGLYNLRFAQEKADLIIEPPVGRFPSLDFARYKEIIAIGYQYARNINVEFPQ